MSSSSLGDLRNPRYGDFFVYMVDRDVLDNLAMPTDVRVIVLDYIGGFSPVDTVVVIGYSFPIFNRRLDRVVFEALRPKEVFLQVAGDDAVTDRLVGLEVEPEIVKVVGDRDQFFIPYSYSPRAWMSRWDRRAH